MKLSWKDTVAAILALIGLMVVYAKLQSYTWWLIGSWKGALGVLAVLGLGILLTGITELILLDTSASIGELLLWVITASVVVGGLFAYTTKTEFVYAASFIGLSWLAQLASHSRHSSHSHGHHYMHA